MPNGGGSRLLSDSNWNCEPQAGTLTGVSPLESVHFSWKLSLDWTRWIQYWPGKISSSR